MDEAPAEVDSALLTLMLTLMETDAGRPLELEAAEEPLAEGGGPPRPLCCPRLGGFLPEKAAPASLIGFRTVGPNFANQYLTLVPLSDSR